MKSALSLITLRKPCNNMHESSLFCSVLDGMFYQSKSSTIYSQHEFTATRSYLSGALATIAYCFIASCIGTTYQAHDQYDRYVQYAHLFVYVAVLQPSVLRQLCRPRRSAVSPALHHHRLVRTRLREVVVLLPSLLCHQQRGG